MTATATAPGWGRFGAAVWAVAAAAVLFIALFARSAHAAFTPPPLTGHVVDTAGKLSPADVRYLDARLERFRGQTGVEIVAFVVGSLEGETIEDVAYDAFNTWQIGRKGEDNGVLLVIAPSARRVRIETGKGVGGALTDLQTNDIIRQTIAPLLRQDRFRDAIEQGSAAIADAYAAGTPDAKPQPPPQGQAKRSPLSVGATFGALVLVLLLAIVSPTFRSFLWLMLTAFAFGGGRGRGGGDGGGSGYSGGGGRSGGGGSSDSY
jgi:uncharacterized protein